MSALSYNKSLELTTWNLKGSHEFGVLGIQDIIGASATGRWDSQTVRAVRTWQSVNGLDADGYFGPQSQFTLGLTHPRALWKWRYSPARYKAKRKRPKGPSPKRTQEILATAKREGLVLCMDAYSGNPDLPMAALQRDYGLSEVAIKLAEGHWFNRVNFDYCVRMCLRAQHLGINRGHYSYLRPGRRDGSVKSDAREEADSILRIEKKAHAAGVRFNRIMWADVESGDYDDDDNPEGLKPDEMEMWLVHFKRRYNKRLTVYLYDGFFDEVGKLDHADLKDLPRVVAKYPEIVSISSQPRHAWDGWQCASSICHPEWHDGKNLERGDAVLIKPASLPRMTLGCG